MPNLNSAIDGEIPSGDRTEPDFMIALTLPDNDAARSSQQQDNVAVITTRHYLSCDGQRTIEYRGQTNRYPWFHTI